MGWRGITWSGEEARDVPTTNPSLPQDFSFVDFALVGKSRYTHIYVYNIYIYICIDPCCQMLLAGGRLLDVAGVQMTHNRIYIYIYILRWTRAYPCTEQR